MSIKKNPVCSGFKILDHQPPVVFPTSNALHSKIGISVLTRLTLQFAVSQIQQFGERYVSIVTTISPTWKITTD